MLEIIVLVFLIIHIGNVAERKGLSSLKWRWITFAAWIAFEFVGLFIAIILFGLGNFVGLMLFGLASGFGGYLFVKYNLDKRPDSNINDDINQIGSN